MTASLALTVCSIADVAGITSVTLVARQQFHVSIFTGFEFRFHFFFLQLGLLSLAHYVYTISAYG